MVQVALDILVRSPAHGPTLLVGWVGVDVRRTPRLRQPGDERGEQCGLRGREVVRFRRVGEELEEARARSAARAVGLVSHKRAKHAMAT